MAKKASSRKSTSVPKKKEKKLKILMVGAEAAPYATVGGFSSVLAYLSRALVNRGHDVRLFIPKFGLIDEEKFKTKIVHKGLRVPTGDETHSELICNVKMCTNCEDSVPTYFLENQEYYEKRANVYGYSDDATRWALLSRGVLEFIRTEEFVPDIIHCNDWHTGLVSNYLKTEYRKDPILGEIATVYTIHNINFQGSFDHKHVTELDYDDGKSPVAPFFSPALNNLNYMRRGILYADAVNTVSRTYSREILTPEFGEGLERLLLEIKGKLFGIVNGLDYKEYNPETDNLVEKNYSIDTLEDRTENKVALLKEFGLEPSPTTMVLGYVGRVDWQKGIDLIVNTLRHALVDYDIQFVQVGGGDGGLTQMLYDLKNEFPDKVGIHPYPNFTLPRLLFSGCDCMLLPSRFEPCGIVQIESMRYGAIPIVRKVGGLADTVENFNSAEGTGNGLVFTNFNEFSLFGQIARAAELFNNKCLWKKLVLNAMSSDYSWEFSSKEYEKLYSRAITFKEKKNPREKSVEDVITF